MLTVLICAAFLRNKWLWSWWWIITLAVWLKARSHCPPENWLFQISLVLSLRC